MDNLISIAREYMTIVAAAFAAAGLPLDYFPENDDFRELWQYDGFDYGKDIIVQLYVSVNGHNRPGIFGDCEIAGQGYDLSCCAQDWMENFGEKVIKAISEGKPPF